MKELIEGQRRWFNEPWVYVRQVLKVEPDPWQDEALHAIARQDKLAMQACKGPGKSAVDAWIAWWYLQTRPHPNVVATSISGPNLKDGLWKEMAVWQKKSPLLLKEFEWTQTRITYRGSPETWFMSARTWSKSANNQEQADTLAGIHANFVLFIIDEAGGVPDAVAVAAKAAMANANKAEGREAKLVLSGNPTVLEGPLYRAATSERTTWYVIEITADPDDPKRTTRVDADYARGMIREYGVDHPWVRVNIFGKYPLAQSNTLIGLDVATDASKRRVDKREFLDAARILGVDVARFGDARTVIAARQGKCLFKLRVMRSMDTVAVAGQVAMVAEKWQPAAIFVDTVGVGAGVYDQLRNLKFHPTAVDGSGAPIEPRWLNKRAECWGEMAKWAKTAMIPNDAELVREMATPTYWITAKGKTQLEGKDDLRGRGVESPDKADAVSLTFAMPVLSKHQHEGLLLAGAGETQHEWNPFEERQASTGRAPDWNPFDD